MRILIACVLLSGAALAQDKFHDGAKTNAPEPHAMTVVSSRFERNPNGEMAVVGIVSNTTEKTLGHVLLKAKFYGRDGSVVGNGTDRMNDLGPREIWSFNVRIPSSVKNNPLVFRADERGGVYLDYFVGTWKLEPLWKP